MRISQISLVIGLAVLVACSGKPETAKPPAADSSTMQMAMQGMQMMPLMRAHLDSLDAMDSAGMAAAMAVHQDLASRMMDAMGADMRGMNMQPDSVWAALADSVRQDLGELSGLSGGALESRMQAHIGRMRRMLAMHQGMMRM